MATIEAYLDNDGNVTPTADQLFTHRHTVRYRLERVKELCGHDITSTEGREKLGLGLKAMRVLGIAAAARPGARARHRGGPGEGAAQAPTTRSSPGSIAVTQRGPGRDVLARSEMILPSPTVNTCVKP